MFFLGFLFFSMIANNNVILQSFVRVYVLVKLDDSKHIKSRCCAVVKNWVGINDYGWPFHLLFERKCTGTQE